MQGAETLANGGQGTKVKSLRKNLTFHAGSCREGASPCLALARRIVPFQLNASLT